MPTRTGNKARRQRNRNVDGDAPKSNEKGNRHGNDDVWYDQFDSPSMGEDYEDYYDEDIGNDSKGGCKTPKRSATELKQQQNKPKSISSADNVVFDRCQQPVEFADDPQQELPPLAHLYAPVVRARFNLRFNLPENHTSIKQYELCVQRTLKIPYYIKPQLGSEFPCPEKRAIFVQRNVSLLPILITAHRNNIDILRYDIVSERNSFRKIIMNDEDYVIGIERFGRTLFFRRYDDRKTDLNDQGHRFEQMCTVQYESQTSYHHLVEGNIGALKVLISAEIDAVDSLTEQPIELKSRVNSTTVHDPYDCWLQVFLGGVSTVIVGTCTNKNPLKLVALHQKNVDDFVSSETKHETMKFLHQVLQFLQDNVDQDVTYLFSRRYDQRNGRFGLHLYRVANKDKHELSFISQRMLNEIGFKIQ